MSSRWAPGAHLKLDFASTEVKFAVLDVDLVLLFPDGAKVILPGYAFNLVGQESADATFTDAVVSPQQLLAHVDELHLLNDNAPLLGSGTKADPHNQDQEKQTDDKKETAEDAPAAPPPQPAAPSAKIAAVADFDKPPEPPADRSLKKPPEDAIPVAAGSAPGSHHTPPTTRPSRQIRIQGRATAMSAPPIFRSPCWASPGIRHRRCLQAASRFSARRPRFQRQPTRRLRSSSRCGPWSGPARTTSSTRQTPIACRPVRPSA